MGTDARPSDGWVACGSMTILLNTVVLPHLPAEVMLVAIAMTFSIALGSGRSLQHATGLGGA